MHREKLAKRSPETCSEGQAVSSNVRGDFAGVLGVSETKRCVLYDKKYVVRRRHAICTYANGHWE